MSASLSSGSVHCLTSTSFPSAVWLIGCYIVEFEQAGDDRASYGDKLLYNLEKSLDVKGLDERRFREFRRFYSVYPQLRKEITKYIPDIEGSIRHLLSAEFRTSDKFSNWSLPANIILYKLSYTHLRKIAPIDDPVKRAFYEMECIKGCWSVAELDRQNAVDYLRTRKLYQHW